MAISSPSCLSAKEIRDIMYKDFELRFHVDHVVEIQLVAAALCKANIARDTFVMEPICIIFGSEDNTKTRSDEENQIKGAAITRLINGAEPQENDWLFVNEVREKWEELNAKKCREKLFKMFSVHMFEFLYLNGEARKNFSQFVIPLRLVGAAVNDVITSYPSRHEWVKKIVKFFTGDVNKTAGGQTVDESHMEAINNLIANDGKEAGLKTMENETRSKTILETIRNKWKNELRDKIPTGNATFCKRLDVYLFGREIDTEGDNVAETMKSLKIRK